MDSIAPEAPSEITVPRQSAPAVPITPILLKRIHDQRLRSVYRSSGWPCLDPIETDLLAAGLLERVPQPKGTELVRVTEAGLQRLAISRDRNRSALDLHDALVARVAEEQVRQGRIAYLGLQLFSKPDDQWLRPVPDVFTIRNTTREDAVCPAIFEIKVRRADLLSDLKKPEKRASYIALSSECYYVLVEGIAKPEEIPQECGVIIATATALEIVRVSPKREMTLSFSHWMALAKADRFRCDRDPESRL